MCEFRLPHVLQRFVGTNFLPYQKWFYLTIYVLNTPKIPDQIITLRRTSSIVPCRNASCNILRICFNGSEMTTCLTHDQINDKRKMPIFERRNVSWKWEGIKEKFPKPKFEHMCCELDSMSELSGFVYTKSHVTLQVKSKAQKVNWSYHGMGARSLLWKLRPN